MSTAQTETTLINTRAGGVYIPPARLRMMQQQITDKNSAEYQRITWEALKKSINGLINKVNTSNIKNIIFELINENLIRGRGLFARSIMKAQAASLPFTPVYAALVSVVNTKFPQVGALLCTRLVVQFRKAYRRNDKTACLATTTFIAHLCNQSVLDELVALQILVLLLERPTNDSVEIAVGFMREVGALLAEVNPKANNSVYDRFRAILHEGSIDKRVQYMIEVLFQLRKDKYKENPMIPDGLDLVEEGEQCIHHLALDDELDVEEELDAAQKIEIHDRTNTSIIHLRRTIYLTIKSSVDYEECCHKLMKLNIKEGQELELANMIIECCSQERTYEKFFGLVGERLSKLNIVWARSFEQCFVQYFTTIHRYETNRLRQISKFFGHLLATDAISWEVMKAIQLTEEDTTSSSRIFVKILFEELSSNFGIVKLRARLQSEEMKPFVGGLFPTDNPKNMRFAINYFTSIGLGALTEELREHLKNAPKLLMTQKRKLSSSSSGSDEDDSSSSASSSGSETDSDARRDVGRVATIEIVTQRLAKGDL
ncbi:3685_t:CDS:2 [Paraglomus brasilianum]|uniref:3685_t:CDS:1 n=1 Tax=Paraglomus brasilianum TaxID=144538 RepID=A0A9N8ZFU2_9GLOM|nr:3685_t:CDS:2 [Paraglomus brasilianum]